MISIIVPAYNRLEVLKRCLESMVSEYYCGLEIIVIDDGSTDGTRPYLREMALEYDFIKVLFNDKNFGVNYARNRGIEAVSNPYLMFIDSDDTLIKGAVNAIRSSINNSAGRSHYLFILSYRASEYKELAKPKEIYYENWMRGNISGDFTHVVLTDVFKNYLFFEQFRMFEQLNWFRVLKATSPQLLMPVVVADIDLGRTDSLSVSQKLKSVSEIEAKFLSEKFLYELLHKDLKLYNPSYLVLPLLKNVLLGIACNKKSDAKLLIKYAYKPYVKLAGHLLFLLPSRLALVGVTKFSNFKRKFSAK